MIVIICWILGGISAVLLYIAVNQTLKLSKLQTQYTEDVESVELYTYNVYFFILSILIQLDKDLKDIDHKGIFEKDDEVGLTFSAIKEAIEQVRHELAKLSTESVDETQENPNVEKNVFHVGGRRRDHTLQSNRKSARKGSDLHKEDTSRAK